jgi:predicted lipid carrier protein YhbT
VINLPEQDSAMQQARENVTIPRILTAPMHVLPLWPVSIALSQLARKLLRAHPTILNRIDKYQDYLFELDITDLPFILRLHPARAELRAFRRSAAPDADARISGSLAAFLAMLHGVEDGDSLYFSGALQIEGDTSAVLALRNALDDAELDLSTEIANALPLLAPPLRLALAPLEKLTGLHLQRADTTPEVY